MYTIVAGLPVVPSADVADATSDLNGSYPNGIGKRNGMFFLRDTGTAYELFMADGPAPTDTCTKVGDGAGAVVVTPA
jgi:hypothetical protein